MDKALSIFDRKELKNLILIMISLWSIPSLIPFEWSLGASGTTTFFMLYAIVYYIKIYNPHWASNNKLLNFSVITGFVLAFGSILILDIVGTKFPIIGKYACYYIRENWRILPMIISLGIFLKVTQLRASYSKIINGIGGLTFAVYLIHMHPIVENYLFKHVFVLRQYIDTWYLPIYVVATTLLIFTVASFVEYTSLFLSHLVGYTWSTFRVRKTLGKRNA